MVEVIFLLYGTSTLVTSKVGLVELPEKVVFDICIHQHKTIIGTDSFVIFLGY